MKKLSLIILLLVLVAFVLILKYESTPRVSIPMIPEIVVEPKEEVVVEAYLRTRDISELTAATPVLGGTWYLTSVVVDSTSNTARIVYEDGHIAGSGTVSYVYDQTTGVVSVNGFTKEE